jgi:MFS-type transporter involved in bile tolerance (Atg22 family)
VGEFWALAVVVALVLGGSQALSRSLFSQMIPHEREAEFFSFYEISERGTSWIGPLLFGLVTQATGSMRTAIFSLIVLFIAWLLMLITVDVPRHPRVGQCRAGSAAGAAASVVGLTRTVRAGVGNSRSARMLIT